MDLATAMGTLLSWILYVGLGLSVALLMFTLALAAFGKWSSKLFFSSLAGILIGSTAYLLQRALVEGISLGDPFTLIALLVVSGFIVICVVSFGLGNPEAGAKYFLAAVLAAGFFAAVPAIQALFGTGVATSTGVCTLEVKQLGQNNTDTVQLEFTITRGEGNYDLAVFWGDGNYDRTRISSGQSVTMSHKYSEEGGYGIIATARGEEGGICTATLGVNVKKTPLPWFSAFFDSGGATNVVGQLVSIPYQLFYTSPEFDTRAQSEDMKIYKMVAALSISFLGIFVVLRFASGFMSRDPTESLIDSMRDAIVVIVGILIAPYIYQIFVSLCNLISLSAAYQADLMNPVGLSVVIGLIAASVVLGVFSSFFGTLGGTLAAIIMLASIMAMIRFALIKAIVFCIPLLAVAFLFPVARGVVRFFISFLIGLILAGPVAAFVLVGLGTLPGIGGIAKFLAPAVAMIAFPFIFTAASGAGPSAAAFPLARMGSGLLGSLSPRGSGASSGAVNVNTPGSPGGGAGSSVVKRGNEPSSGSGTGDGKSGNNQNQPQNKENEPGPGGGADTSVVKKGNEPGNTPTQDKIGGSKPPAETPQQDGAPRLDRLSRLLTRPDFQSFMEEKGKAAKGDLSQTTTAENRLGDNSKKEEQVTVDTTKTPVDKNNQNVPSPPSKQQEVKDNKPSPEDKDKGQQEGRKDAQQNPAATPMEKGRLERAKEGLRKVVETRNRIARRYNAIGDSRFINKVSPSFRKGFSLVLGGLPSEKGGNRGKTKEEIKAYVEAEKARKQYYEVRTKVLESLEKDLLGDKKGKEDTNENEEEE